MRLYEQIEFYENRLQNIPRSKRYIIYLASIILLGLLFYTYVLGPQFDHIQDLQARLQQLQNKVAKTSPKHYESIIMKKKQELANLRAKLDELKQKEYALLQKLQMQKYLFLNQQNFAKLLEDILADSKKRGVVLSLIQINEMDKKFLGRLKEQKSLKIQGQGAFLQSVRFLRDIEKHPMLLRVDNLHFETNGTVPRLSFWLKLYGVEK
ncbi:hypothetical protein [Nitratiruptor sp. YY09-18]|uniref:hypothetical protein n=1 Tax=Nitratiruptor sp. YY09-18 TaxID=2724901 RepID=UPI001915BD0B|nr:hypothetical protein [Nitratiruptor sp. YY09-18]BCD68674.1 MSHA biogenesis protein MshJ [Nitratiruptor sp. YY09-18]